MTQGLTNIMRREAERAMERKASTCMGIVSGYDPAHYAAKVKLQPDGQETGFLPIASPWVGNGWGFFAPPSLGDQVDVHFQEAGKGAPYISLRFFGNAAQPLAVQSGEFWLVHASGSTLKFHDDGTISVSSAAAINVTAPLTTVNGNVVVNGMIQATGDIWDNYLTTGYTMASFRADYDIHTHGNVYNGGGYTSVPMPTL